MRLFKKIGFLMAFSALFGACDLRTEPEFLHIEADFGFEFFGAATYNSYHIRRDLEFSGSNATGTQRVVFLLPEIRLGKFPLGQGEYAEARFVKSDEPSPTSTSYNSTAKGEVEILEIDSQDSTISGRFWFDAANADQFFTPYAMRAGIFRDISIRGAFDQPLFTGAFEAKHLGQKIAFRHEQVFYLDETTGFFNLRARHASGRQFELRFPSDLGAGTVLNSAAVKSAIGADFYPEINGQYFPIIGGGSFEMLQNDPVARVVEARFSLILKSLDGLSSESLTDGYLRFNY